MELGTGKQAQDYNNTVSKIVSIMIPYSKRFNANMARVAHLIALHGEISLEHNTRDMDDILRAAVVLLHATLEDFLRTLASDLLPLADEDVLNKIPFAGSKTDRPEKIHLGYLTQHRGKTVEELISASINDHLDGSSYNSSKDLAGLLSKLKFDTCRLEEYFPSIDSMMQRRHQIVHRADRVKDESGEEIVATIDADIVKKWAGAIRSCYGKILGMHTENKLDAGTRTVLKEMIGDGPYQVV